MRDESYAVTATGYENESVFTGMPLVPSGSRPNRGQLSHTDFQNHIIIENDQEYLNNSNCFSLRQTAEQLSVSDLDYNPSWKNIDSLSYSAENSPDFWADSETPTEAPVVSIPTPSAETGARSEIKVPWPRVNASERAKFLEGGTKRSASQMSVVDNNDDATIAQRLQTKERPIASSKKQKARGQGRRNKGMRMIREEVDMFGLPDMSSNENSDSEELSLTYTLMSNLRDEDSSDDEDFNAVEDSASLQGPSNLGQTSYNLRHTTTGSRSASLEGETSAAGKKNAEPIERKASETSVIAL